MNDELRKLPYMNKPCRDCPFRKDCLKGWLGRIRMQEILAQHSFVCHKDNKLQCAGHMILRGDFNMFVSLARALKYVIHLTGHNLVFDIIKQCEDHHAWEPIYKLYDDKED